MNKLVHNNQAECTTSSDKYHPSDLDNFLPWACSEMGVEAMPVIITRIEQGLYSSSTVSCRKAKSIKYKEALTTDMVTPLTKSQSPIKSYPTLEMFENVIKIDCVYNTNSLLVKIKFSKNKKVPKYILKLLTIALPYHIHLTAIHIDGGLHPELIFDLTHIVTISNITEVNLDNTWLEGALVHILLEENIGLKHLSLARCTLNDDMVKAIASKLSYPLPASKKLCILNLSSNRITDIGAKCLADTLRTNRQLVYLNLSGNMIGEAGAASILDCLKEFPLTPEELKDLKIRNLQYLKLENYLKNKRYDASDKKSITSKSEGKKKVTKPIPILPMKKSKTGDTERANQTSGASTVDGLSLDACNIAVKDNIFGPFEDPFRSENTMIENGVTYCFGNNTLCYLNLAYNNLNYFNVQKICSVLYAQRNLNRRPKGLINICIEGNNVPACEELKEISLILESNLNALSRVSINLRKRLSSKFSAR